MASEKKTEKLLGFYNDVRRYDPYALNKNCQSMFVRNTWPSLVYITFFSLADCWLKHSQ